MKQKLVKAPGDPQNHVCGKEVRSVKQNVLGHCAGTTEGEKNLIQMRSEKQTSGLWSVKYVLRAISGILCLYL